MADSQAMLNRGPRVSTAIVFVHGWGGSAGGTWEEFPAALRTLPEAAGADAFFIDYPSTKHSVAVCGDEMREFLVDLLRSPSTNVVNPSLPAGAPPRGSAERYARIVIVAHSMGAVVARRALLDLDREELSLPERESIRFLFFAPAHRGSDLPKLVASGFGLDVLPGSRLIGQALRIYYRSLTDLDRNSDCLKDLRDDSKAARARRAQKGEPDDDLRALSLHALDDKVVSQDRFDEDHRGRPIARRHHRSVCKPDAAYRRPVDELRALL
jgi:pimeloyl-ACP methyl ester carboxylesterase